MRRIRAYSWRELLELSAANPGTTVELRASSPLLEAFELEDY